VKCSAEQHLDGELDFFVAVAADRACRSTTGSELSQLMDVVPAEHAQLATAAARCRIAAFCVPNHSDAVTAASTGAAEELAVRSEQVMDLPLSAGRGWRDSDPDSTFTWTRVRMSGDPCGALFSVSIAEDHSAG
jgi:hypothetical protein